MMPELVNFFKADPWARRCRPFQMAPHVWYVGNTYVGSYLIDASEGLVLLDQGFAETVYLLFESIRQLGFSPEKIKHILVSHGHVDHCGGTRLVQEYSGGKVYMSEEDFSILKEHPEWVFLGNVNRLDFEADVFYRDGGFLDFGDIKIQTLLTPGHTPGTTSFVFEDHDSAGRAYRCVMHGGVGLNTLERSFYEEYPGWPENLLSKYIQSMRKMLDIEADIPLPSHPGHIPIFDKAGLYREGPENPFINPQGYRDMITGRLERAARLECPERIVCSESLER